MRALPTSSGAVSQSWGPGELRRTRRSCRRSTRRASWDSRPSRHAPLPLPAARALACDSTTWRLLKTRACAAAAAAAAFAAETYCALIACSAGCHLVQTREGPAAPRRRSVLQAGAAGWWRSPLSGVHTIWVLTARNRAAPQGCGEVGMGTAGRDCEPSGLQRAVWRESDLFGRERRAQPQDTHAVRYLVHPFNSCHCSRPGRPTSRIKCP